MRGFASAGIGPRDTLSANQDALGGSMYFRTSAELLFAIPGVPNDLGLRGEIFTDVGSLWGTTKTIAATPGVQGSAFAPRASAGVGLLWEVAAAWHRHWRNALDDGAPRCIGNCELAPS